MKNKKGFTLVEIVIVIAVIAVLASVLIPTFAGILERTKENARLQQATSARDELIGLSQTGLNDIVGLIIQVEENYYLIDSNGELLKQTTLPSSYTTSTISSSNAGISIYEPAEYEIVDTDLVFYIDESKKTATLCGYYGEPVEIIVPEYIHGSVGKKLKKKVTTEGGNYINNDQDVRNALANGESVTIYYGDDPSNFSTFTLDSENTRFTVYDNTHYEYEVMAEVYATGAKNYRVTGIGMGRGVTSGLEGCVSLEKITLPDGFNEIGFSSFSSCSNLKEIINFPQNVTRIEPYAFSGCNSLENLVLPETVTYIGEYAFQACYSLTDFYLPESLTYIETGVFNLCEDEICTLLDGIYYVPSKTNQYFLCYESKYGTNMTSYTIHEDSVIMAEISIMLNNSLETVIFPETSKMKYICSNAFYSCSKLTSLTIPKNVVNISSGFIYSCSALTSLKVVEENTVYDSRDNCNAIIETATNTIIFALSNATIPEGIEHIGTSAFSGCKTIKTLVLPDSLITIGNYAFSSCTEITSVIFGNNLVSIGNQAFNYCTGITSITFGNKLEFIDNLAFNNCSSLLELILPDSLKIIGDSVFSGCTSLTSISIPKGIEEIGSTAFRNCPTTLYNVYDNAYYLGHDENPYAYCVQAIDKTITSVTLHEDTELVAGGAFTGCTNLIEVNLPQSIKSISKSMFNGCTSLQTITLPSTITIINGSAFSGCTSLTTINLSSSLEEIEGWAFYNCKSLTNLIFPSSLKKIGMTTFYNCQGLTTITIPSTLEFIDNYAFNVCTNLDVVIIETQQVASQITADETPIRITDNATIIYIKQDLEVDKNYLNDERFYITTEILNDVVYTKYERK